MVIETTEATAEALLAPWLAHASRHMVREMDVITEPSGLDKSLWMTWALKSLESQDEWISTLETIELLDLFVRLDYVAGWTWISKRLGVLPYLGMLKRLPERIYPKHEFAWRELSASFPDSGTRLDRAKQLALAIPDELHSPQFLAVRDEMMARWGRQRPPEDRVHVRLWLRFDNGDACALKELVEFAALVQDPSRLTLLDALAGATPAAAAARPSDVFQLDGFEVDAGRTALTDALLTSISPLLADDLLTLPTLVACLRSLFVSNIGGTALSIDRIGADLEPAVFQAICSAVAATSSLCDVRFAASVSGVYWPWLAYALLRSDVRPRCITSVGVNVECLTLQDVPKIERVLRARDPLAALATTAAPDDRSREVVDVGPHTTSLVPTRTTTDGDPAFAVIGIDETGCLDLDVVETVGAHVGVLYPGAGVCYVRRDEIVPQRRASSLPPSPPPALRSLELHLYDGTSLDALLLLLQLVGPFTQRLVLFGGDNIELSDSFMLGLPAACPQLERLNLSYFELESFGWLTHNETVRLASLDLKNVHSSDPQGLVPIAAELRDTTRRLGSTLRELTIAEYACVIGESIPEFLDMLKTNHRLEYLLFSTHFDDDETFGPQFHSHDDEPLQIPDGPFPTRSRLALLSVLKHRSDLTVLTPDTLALVFELAAPNKYRVCGFVHKYMPPP